MLYNVYTLYIGISFTAKHLWLDDEQILLLRTCNMCNDSTVESNLIYSMKSHMKKTIQIKETILSHFGHSIVLSCVMSSSSSREL